MSCLYLCSLIVYAFFIRFNLDTKKHKTQTVHLVDFGFGIQNEENNDKRGLNRVLGRLE